MKPDGSSVVPDFSSRLQTAMDNAGYQSGREVADRMTDLGVPTRRETINRLLRGSESEPPNPTYKVVAALAIVCDVPVSWFFELDASRLVDEMQFYRSRGVNPD